MLFAGFKMKKSGPFSQVGLRFKKKTKVPNAMVLQNFIQKHRSIAETEHTRIKNLEQHFNDDDQTTNPNWLFARKHIITGSVQGALGGCNPFESADDYLRKKIHPKPMDKKGQTNCRWGNLNEPEAEKWFAREMERIKNVPPPTTWSSQWTLIDYKIEELGLYICKEENYACCGMSPDGVLYTTWKTQDGKTLNFVELIEYKCPVPKYDPDVYSQQQTAKMLGVELGVEGDDAPQNGNHVYKYSNGDEYGGDWLNGKRHGGGRYTFADGTVFDADNWCQGRLGKIVKDRFGNPKALDDPSIRIKTTKVHRAWFIPRTIDEFYKKFVLEQKTWRDKCNNPRGLYKEKWLPQKVKDQSEYNGKYPESDWSEIRKKLPVPPYYNAQIQYGMELFRRSGWDETKYDGFMEKCHFVVHCPVKTSRERVDRDKKYGKWLLERSKKFWTERYAPNFVLASQGKLFEGEIV